MNKLAIDLAPEGGFKGFGKLGLEGETADNASLVFTNFISSAIGVITVVAIIWFVFLVITGAFGFLSAGSDKTAVESARKKLINGLTGLVVVILGIFVVRLVGYLIGIPDILNISNFITIISGDLAQ